MCYDKFLKNFFFSGEKNEEINGKNYLNIYFFSIGAGHTHQKPSNTRERR